MQDWTPGRIYTRLPKMWVGLFLAVLCALFQFAGEVGEAGVFLVSMAGTCYWMFCVYRIHKVLAEYTCSAYPISARKAVGFQFIPLFEYYWFFRWTRKLAGFLDGKSGKRSVARVWPGVLLTATSLLGWYPGFKSLRLFLIFGLGIYFTRKLRAALPPCRPMALERWHQWNLSMSAGVGAAFSFVLFQAVRDFAKEQRQDQFHDLTAIFLVSVGVLIFLEPIFGKLRGALGIAENHPALEARKSWLLRLAVFGILTFTSLFHGLLHSEIHNALHADWSGTVTMLMAALLVTGSITYFWIAAAHRKPSHAARSGLLSGSLVGCLIAYAAIAGILHTHAPKTDHRGDSPQQLVAHYALPSVPPQISDDLAAGKLKKAKDDFDSEGGLSQMQSIFLLPFSWPVFGLAGGIAIDRRWGKDNSRGIALSIFTAALLYAAGLWLSRRPAFGTEMIPPLSVALGWGLALMVCSSSKVLLPEESHQSSTAPEREAGDAQARD